MKLIAANKVYIGTSTETKPTVDRGSKFVETDTRAEYMTDGSTWINMSYFSVNSTGSTGTHTMAIPTLATKHQLCCEVSATSGIITVSYRPAGSTVYVPMSDTIDPSSGPVVQLFSGVYDSLYMTHTLASSTPVKFKYIGWKE